MKILVVCQYYYPEPFRINDICEELVRRGHEVVVVTGEPNYPEGKIYKGYEHHQKSDEMIGGVKVHRCPIFPRKAGPIYRLLNYFSYPYLAKRYIRNLKAFDGKNFDIVFTNQLSPVMMSLPAIDYKKRYGVPVLMYCLDLWPHSLIAGGISTKSGVYKGFHRISKNIYTKMDRILISSKMFRAYLVNEFGIETSRIHYLPQYAERLFEKLPYRKTDKIINFVFAGNIGVIQNIETILEAAKKLEGDPFHFHIVGGGTDLDRLRQIAKGLKNVTFYGRLPLEEMPEIYAKADAMLVTLQADPVLSLTLPGKVQSYMAVGKPIIGAINGETANVIKDAQCGYCGPAEDVDILVHNIRRFRCCNEKERLGKNARRYYEAKFGREIFMNTLEGELLRVCEGRGSNISVDE